MTREAVLYMWGSGDRPRTGDNMIALLLTSESVRCLTSHAELVAKWSTRRRAEAREEPTKIARRADEEPSHVLTPLGDRPPPR